MIILHHINDEEGRAPHNCWNLGPQLPCYATARSVLSINMNELLDAPHRKRLTKLLARTFNRNI